jgi:hypothetical protein
MNMTLRYPALAARSVAEDWPTADRRSYPEFCGEVTIVQHGLSAWPATETLPAWPAQPERLGITGPDGAVRVIPDTVVAAHTPPPCPNRCPVMMAAHGGPGIGPWSCPLCGHGLTENATRFVQAFAVAAEAADAARRPVRGHSRHR